MALEDGSVVEHVCRTFRGWQQLLCCPNQSLKLHLLEPFQAGTGALQFSVHCSLCSFHPS